MSDNVQHNRHGLVAAATRKHKLINQDACLAIGGSSCTVSALIVADGIGSDRGSENISAEIVRYMAQQIREDAEYSSRSDDIHRMRSLFRSTRERLAAVRETSVAEGGEELRRQFSGGSTALCIVEKSDRVLAAYVGNGGLLQMRADFNDFPAYLLPWSTVNLLNSHSFYKAGGTSVNPLYRYLSADVAAHQAEPSVLAISKDDDGAGDIFVACTDGLFSGDQADVTSMEDGAWVRTAPPLLLLYRHLDGFFSKGQMTFKALEETLQMFLEEVNSNGMAEDDCTIGVLITPRALEYQRSRMARKAVAR